VDDEPEIGQVIAECLGDDRHRCETVTSGQLAYSRVCERDYDVVISDVVMPGMSGLELLDRVVAIRPQSRVILVTGYGSRDDLKRAVRRGAFDYIEKPFDIDRLRHVVDEAIRWDGRDKEASSDTSRIGSPGPDTQAAVRHDPLTGLLNHRFFHEELATLRMRCRRGNHPLSVLLIDLDRFGRVNESCGYAFGDFALREVARRLRLLCRDADVVARYGGQVFAVALFETSADHVGRLAEKIRSNIANSVLMHEDQHVRLNVTIGVAQSDVGFLESPGDLVGRAQQAVSYAKRRGVSQVVRWDQMNLGPPEDSSIDRSRMEELSEQFGHLNQKVKRICLESTQALVAAVEAKDPYTQQHSLKVATYATTLAGLMRLDTAFIETLKVAALLHDVGKIGIPDPILTKSGELTEDEFALVRRHPVLAAQILQNVSFLKGELPMILHHHERWDGQGYPSGLVGEEIPLGARILHVADAIEAMLARRSYKPSYPIDRVRTELRNNSGTQFDPDIVNLAVAWLGRSTIADVILT